MKNLSILVLILTVSVSCFAQKKVGGFYKGTLFNDSTKMVQQYELALAEYRGKIMGYAYVTFVANDTFYYGIRKIKAKIDGDNLVVEDDKMIANNFPESPAKHVNRTVTIPFNGKDSLVSANGRWITNKTKIYYAVPGSVEATKSNDSSSSALFAHLKELNLMPNDNYAATETVVQTKPKQKEKELKTEDPVAVKTKTESKESKVKVKSENKENSSVAETKVKDNKTKIESDPQQVAQKTVVSKSNVPVTLSYNERKERVQQTLEVSSDSLVLSFYDNGVVDGDSISVYLNNQQVISSTKLTSVATKKTIYVGGMDEIKLLLVAENLGTIPPNTGLLVIREGTKTYQVNFTADMQTNASIILKRKKNQ